MPYKLVGWAEDEELADQLLLIPVVVAHRFNHLIKATSVAALSGAMEEKKRKRNSTLESLERSLVAWWSCS